MNMLNQKADLKSATGWRLHYQLLRFLRPYKVLVYLTIALMFLNACLQLPLPLVTRYLIDSVIPSGQLDVLALLVTFLLLAFFLAQMTGFWQGKLLIKLRINVDRDIRKALYSSVLLSSLNQFEDLQSGYIQSRVDDDVKAVGKLFMGTLLQIATDLLAFVVGACILFYLNAPLAMMTLISIPIIIMCFLYFAKGVKYFAGIEQEKWALHNGSLVEVLKQITLIKAFNRQKEATRPLLDKLDNAEFSSQRMANYSLLATVIVGALISLLPILILWYAVRGIMLGDFTLGGFAAFNASIAYLLVPVRNLMNLNIDIQAALASAKRVIDILSFKTEEDAFAKAHFDEEFKLLECENINFFYDEQQKRGISNLSFTLSRGEIVAVVGETGKGKSTIIYLLLGFYLPQSGRILINGRDHSEYELGAIRDQLAYVQQNSGFFSGTIRDNVSFFDSDTDDDYINEILKICELHDTVARFEHGIDTCIGEDASKLSGGEQQRLAIARALYGKPPLLLLDEATSALDKKTEQRLLTNLANLPWQPAILMITHHVRSSQIAARTLKID